MSTNPDLEVTLPDGQRPTAHIGATCVTDGDDNAFGRYLTSLRDARGWTKTQLADRAGLDPSSVSRLEAGLRAPEPRTVEMLAGALDISPVEHERLLARAGFRSRALTDPIVVELLELMVDPTLPASAVSDLKTLVRIAVEHGRQARDGHKPAS